MTALATTTFLFKVNKTEGNMLNTQITSERRENGSEKTEVKEGKRLPRKTETVAKLGYKNLCTKSKVWFGANSDCISCNSTDSYHSGTWSSVSSMDEGKQENSVEPANPQIEEVRGHFNSKFNNRTPLSLHPPVSMETENSGLFSNQEEVNPEETKRIVRNLEKIRVERHKTSAEKHFFQRQVKETKGEKTIKLAREKNTLPEVISKRRLHETEKRHFLPRLDDKIWSAPPSSRVSVDFDKTFPFDHEDARDPRARDPHARDPHAKDPRTSKRGVLAWSACVFPATLADSPVRKRLPMMTSLRRPHRRMKRNMTDAARVISEPAAYTEQSARVLSRSAVDKPLSGLLYPSHHGD